MQKIFYSMAARKTGAEQQRPLSRRAEDNGGQT